MPNKNINEMPFEIKELFVPSLDQVKNGNIYNLLDKNYS